MLAACPAAVRGQVPSEQIESVYVEVHPDSLARIVTYPWRDHYIPVQVRIGRRTWTQVRMRIRGDSSRNYPKKSFKLQFDGAPLPDGTRTMNLNGDYLDTSYMHSVVSTMLIRWSGHPVFQARHVNLFMNGAFYGLYVQVENMDEAFLAREGMDPQGNLYKAALDGATLSPYDDVDYYWEKKTNEQEGRHDLRQLIQAINAVPAADYADFLRRTFEYESLVNALAINMLIANGSTYYHNYYLYRDVRGTGRWTFLFWDNDFTMATYGSNYPYHRSSGISLPDNPLLERSILSEAVLTDIRARIDELGATIFNPGRLEPVIDSIATAIEASVALDTLDQVPDLDHWRERIQHEKWFVQDRVSRLRTQFETWPRSFRLDPTPSVSEAGVTFRWSPSRTATPSALTYVLRYGMDPAFSAESSTVITGITDTSYTIDPLPPGTYFWLVQATNGVHVVDGYDTWNPLHIGAPAAAAPIITEINYRAAAVGDWVEVYNPGPEPLDLSAWVFTDGPNRFSVPSGTSLAGGRYLVLASDRTAFLSAHTVSASVLGSFDFGLSADGETLRLLDPIGRVVDSVAYRPFSPWPDLTNLEGHTIELLHPTLDNSLPDSWAASAVVGGTPGSNNSVYPAGEAPHLQAATMIGTVYPNPFANAATVPFSLERTGHVRLQVFDLLGREVAVLHDGRDEAGVHAITWSAAALSPGVYVVVLSLDGERVARRTAILVR